MMLIEMIVSGFGFGVIAGMLGIGGGIILMPFLLLMLHSNHDSLHLAVNTSIAIMVISSATNVIQHIRLNNIDKHIVKKLLPGSIMGVVVGTGLSCLISPVHIKMVMSVILIGLTISMLVPAKILRAKSSPGPLNMMIIGFVTGAPASFLGIGGGSIMAPLLNYYGLDMKKIVGTAAFNTFLTTTLALFSLIVVSIMRVHHLSAVGSVVAWKVVIIISSVSLVGLRIGAVIMQKLPERIIRYLFVIVLLTSSLLTLK